MLFTHFTMVNYRTDIPITEKGIVPYDFPFRDYNKYNYGTCENNREIVFRNLIKNNIHYSFSGHSHRSGLYHIIRDGFVTDRVDVTGQSATLNGNKGTYNTQQLNGSSRIIVSGCGGPIAVQNHQQELANLGLDFPSGSFVKFNGSTESEVGTYTSKISTARPRLAVALDFADIFAAEADDYYHRGMFTQFDAHTLEGPFVVKVNEKMKLPDVEWISSATLYIYEQKPKPIAEISLAVTKTDSQSFTMSISKKDIKTLDNILEKPDKKTFFIDLALDSSIQTDVFAHYDISKNWTYQVEFFNPQQEAINQFNDALSTAGANMPDKLYNQRIASIKDSVAAYRIRRHTKYGEVPRHKWYTDINPAEYPFSWNTVGRKDG